ncbi:MAG: co-chaperone GroES [bacterium]|nr:co-chaperone GroES [bacterium]
MNIKPLNDKVVVKPLKQDEKTKSGIFLPDSAREEKPEQGEVVAVGTGKMLDNGTRAVMSVKVGDRVLFTKYSPDEVEIDGIKYLVIEEEKILGVVEA